MALRDPKNHRRSRRTTAFYVTACVVALGAVVSLTLPLALVKMRTGDDAAPVLTPSQTPKLAPQSMPPPDQAAPESLPPLAPHPKEDPAEQARQFCQDAMAGGSRPNEKLVLMRKAAESDCVPAMIEIGQIFMAADGSNEDGLRVTAVEASRWFHRAADLRSTQAMLDLGVMYLLGKGVDPDPATAADWFRKAAERKNYSATYDLALLYENGTGVPLSLEKARQLYKEAADHGNEEARRRLAQLPVVR